MHYIQNELLTRFVERILYQIFPQFHVIMFLAEGNCLFNVIKFLCYQNQCFFCISNTTCTHIIFTNISHSYMFSTALLLKLLELLNQGSMHDKQLHIKCCLKRRDQLGDIGLHVDGRVTLSVSKTKRL